MTLKYDIPRKVVYVATIICMCSMGAISQKYQTAFGRISEFNLGGNVLGLLSGDFNGDGQTDLAAYGSSEITFLYYFDNFTSTQSLRLNDHIEKAVSVDCNRDGISDIVVLTSNPQNVKVFLGKRDTMLFTWGEEIPLAAENVIVTDINNDRKADILLYGKKMLGIKVLLGLGNGTFRSPRTLLEEYSFGDVIVYDLNSDRIMDLITFDWVNNALLVFPGLGRMRFSAPSSIPLSKDEISNMALLFLNWDANLDLLVLQKESKELQTYYGDGLGSFEKGMSIPLHFAPSKMLIDDINGDGNHDVILFSESDRSFSVYFSNGDSTFQRDITYAAGIKPIDILIFRNPKVREPDVAVLDRGRQELLIFHSTEHPPDDHTKQIYALGLKPQSICVFDANNDMNPDLLVTNSRSENISLFLNRGNGTFYGQIPIPVELGAESINSLRKNDSTFFIVTTHPSIDKIVVTEVRYPALTSVHYALSTNRFPEILAPHYDQSRSSLSLLVSGKAESSNSIILSEFYQVDQNNILERQFFSVGGTPLLAADICDMNHDGLRDVAFLFFDSKRKKPSLAISLGKQDGGFAAPTVSYSLPDTGVRDAHIWCTDLNGDKTPDLILQFHSDDDYLAFALGKNDSTFAPIHQRFSQVAIRNRQEILQTDVDGNGTNDLIIENALTKMIQVFPAKKGGEFYKPKRLLSLPAGGGFTVADFNRDGIPDYAVAYSESGMMRVFLGRE